MADMSNKGGSAGGQNPGSSAGQAGTQAAQTAQDMARRASEAASNLGQRAEEVVSGLAGQMQNLAGTLRDKVPQEGMVGSAASTVADSLEAGGRYLQEQSFSDMADDLAGVVRRYPIQSLLVGIGIGFLLSRTTRS